MNKAGLESDHDYCRLWLRISQYKSDLAKYRKEKQKQIRDNTNQSVDNDCITKFISLYKPLIFPTV